MEVLSFSLDSQPWRRKAARWLGTNERSVNFRFQELFEEIDKEDDGVVYLKEIVIHLRAVNEDINDNLKVKMFLDELDTNGSMEVDFKQFCVSFNEEWFHVCSGRDGRPGGGWLEEGPT